MRLNPKILGMATAFVAGTFYFGCMLTMSLAGQDALIFIFNGLFHGLDVRPILVEQPGALLSLVGFSNTVILSWLFGSLLAAAYNMGAAIFLRREQCQSKR